MPFAKPKAASEQLFERLSALATGEPQQQLEIARLRQEAKKLLVVDAASAYQLLGGLATLEFDIRGVHENHQAALHLTASTDAIFNYGVSLQFLGLFREASTYALRAARAEPENLWYLKSAIDYLSYFGELRKALELCKEYEKRAPDQKLDTQRTLSDLLILMERTGISEREVGQSFDIAFEVLRNHKMTHHHITKSVDLTNNSECAHIRIYLVTTADRVRALDLQLGNELANRLDDMHSASLIVDYGSTNVHTKLDEYHPIYFS